MGGHDTSCPYEKRQKPCRDNACVVRRPTKYPIIYFPNIPDIITEQDSKMSIVVKTVNEPV